MFVSNANGCSCRSRITNRGVAVVVVSLTLAGCSLGQTDFRERLYYAVPSKDNTNYYRVTISGNTVLGKTTYQSGWFPADTLDRFAGSPREPGEESTYNAEKDIKTELNRAIKDATVGYLNEAKNPDTNAERIGKLLQAQRRVRAVAGDGVPLPEGAVEIEYDPVANLALRHAGEKRIFVLSSDPNKVMGELSAMAGSKETSATVLRLADVVRQQRENSITDAEARVSADKDMDGLIVAQIDAALTRLAKGGVDRKALLNEVRTLLVLMDNAK